MPPTIVPTIGPSRAPPRMAGTCIIVALPARLGTGIKPRRVYPRKIAIPPKIPAMTICRTLRLKTEPLRPLSELVVISAPPCSLLWGICTGVIIADARLQGGREASVGRRPTAVDQHEGPGDVGACIRGQVYHRPDHL